jgi:transcriptional regulator with XRE-family HTH domain
VTEHDPTDGEAVSVERRAFCKRLKSARESAGLTLEAISEVSKIQVAVLAGLERGDLSRWPGGIFRRSFIREYATAIGLEADEVVRDFSRLFPDSGLTSAWLDSLPQDSPGLRLTLAPISWKLRASWIHAIAALSDVVTVLLAALLATRIVSGPYWTITAAVALIYFGLATALTGGSIGLLWVNGRSLARWRQRISRAEEPAVSDGPRLVFRRDDAPLAATVTDESPVDSAAEDLRAVSK